MADTSGHPLDFGFGFNDSNFSDRTLRIEVVGPVSEGSQSDLAAVRKSKRRRSGETASNDDWNRSEDGLKVLRIKTLHVCSLLLAAKSPFFHKLFSNGMMESDQRRATLRIDSSEEAAFMELLSFMYDNTLTSKTEHALLDVLMIADKFEVASCLTHCIQSLRSLPMTTESALLYLGLPSTILIPDGVKHLVTEAKKFLVIRYKNLSEREDEIMDFSLVGIEEILSRDELCVTSEDEIYDFALKWTKAHYPEPEDQRKILSTRLGPKIRFPYITFRKLRKILTCNDCDDEFATKFAIDALLFNAEEPHHQLLRVTCKKTSNSRCFIERAYLRRPIKVFEFANPNQECLVYLNLKRNECASLFPSHTVRSQVFYMKEQLFSLSANCNMDKNNISRSFGVYLRMDGNGSGTFDVEYDFFVRSKPSKKYSKIGSKSGTFTKGKEHGFHNLLYMQWSSFMAENCVYFINDILHIRAELTIKRWVSES